MYKNCFECPHIREHNPGKPGRISYYCPKLTELLGAIFFIDKMGHRPKICPLLKRRLKRRRKMKEEPGITARLIELSRTSNEAVCFLLSNYKETKINAVHSIRQQIPIQKIRKMRGRRKRDERK